MTSSAKIDETREALRASGLYLVGKDPWPWGDKYILTVGSRHTKLHGQTTASYISSIIGPSVSPLPRDPRYPNLYYFLVELAQPAAGLSISSIEDGEAISIAALYRFPLMSDAQSLWLAKQLRGPSDGVPVFIDWDASLAPGTWYWLQVRYNGRAAQPTAEVADAVVAKGHRAIDPLSGVSGFFESIFYREDYIGPDYSTILFNPGKSVTPASLQSEIFDALGKTTGGAPRAKVVLFTTAELSEGQGKADDIAEVKDMEQSAGDIGSGASEAVSATMDMIAMLFKAIPVVLWIGLAGLVGYGAYKVYGHVTTNKGRRKK